MDWALRKKEFFVVSYICKWVAYIMYIKLVLYYAVRFGLNWFLKLESKTKPNRKKNRTKTQIHPKFCDFNIFGLDWINWVVFLLLLLNWIWTPLVGYGKTRKFNPVTDNKPWSCLHFCGLINDVTLATFSYTSTMEPKEKFPIPFLFMWEIQSIRFSPDKWQHLLLYSVLGLHTLLLELLIFEKSPLPQG